MLDLSKYDTTTYRLRFYARWCLTLNAWLRRNTGFHLPPRLVRWTSERLDYGTSDAPGVWHRSESEAHDAWRVRKRSELFIVNATPQ